MDYLRRLSSCLKRQRLVLLIGFWLMAFLLPLRGAEFFGLIGNPHVEISGFGLFGNIELSRSLDILEPADGVLESFSDIYIEDAIWILSGELKRMGYLKPGINAKLLEQGTVIWSGTWSDGDTELNLDSKIQGDQVILTIHPGVLYYFSKIDVIGMPDSFDQSSDKYFYDTNQLIVSEEDRFFSSGRLLSGADRMVLELKNAGYRDAKSSSEITEQNDTTGAVSVSVTIEPGPVYYIESFAVELTDGQPYPNDLDTVQKDQRLIPDWLRNMAQRIRNYYYAQGHVNVAIESKIEPITAKENASYVAVTLIVDPGPITRIDEVRFENAGETSQGIMKRQAGLKSGELLNRTKVEEGRDKLGRLGVFRSIRIEYEDMDEGQQDVVYDMIMKNQTKVNLIAGVGSYDILRGGFEVINSNLWGQAHQSHLTAIQSFKSTYADYTYTIPQIFGEDLDYFLSADYLRREEITFDREEFGVSTGLQRYFKSINTAASVQYNYGQVEARNAEFLIPPGPERAFVSSITLKANRTDLDNPVYPTDGWQLFGSTEFAVPQLGGNVEYQRIELGGAWHKPLTDSGLVFHIGYKTGVVTSLGPSSENIPVPKRFFLGGENTVRGYRRDQASPINSNGQQIGAVSYMLLQGELEQRLTEIISVVGFVDTVGNAASINDYPFNEVLMSVGGGISIRTVVGPLRFEYGHNVKKRPSDPDGTFQVALGFPF